MVDFRVCGEEVFEHRVVVCLRVVERQIYLYNLHLWEMVAHVVSESHLPVGLLFRRHSSVLGLLHQHYLGFFRCYQHKHTRCEIS